MRALTVSNNKGSNLPDMKYLGNVLTKQFGL